ncbi:sulfite exporter TauE/SafE family protein [Halobacillus naozhouensis]|uniref:Sulfite exporter TauE/SafE family protein n=1 Tax=Halobacillus naozhouensis TaxID=554880 RepID=A0ABY8IZR9_9BACI|nr:sulfite exporter TauE/SafE family protein [Halobacillus naozhouensis]WFT74121.1 sulfite exporter TauE/SafE family protein [Halobacillus naozhouensis]
MEVSFLSILLFGFLLGIKHSLEPDHVIAVSNIASETKTLRRSSITGVSWGVGHTFTLLIIGLTVIMMKVQIAEVWAMSFEFLVGLMLIYLGIKGLFAYRSAHVQKDSGNMTVMKSFVIGFVHGLAGSAAMILLTASTVSSVWEGAVYILVFGLGTVAGMLLFTTIIGVPFVLSAGRKRLNRTLTGATGFISMGFGLYYVYNLGITEGLFKLWMS